MFQKLLWKRCANAGKNSNKYLLKEVEQMTGYLEITFEAFRDLKKKAENKFLKILPTVAMWKESRIRICI